MVVFKSLTGEGRVCRGETTIFVSSFGSLCTECDDIIDFPFSPEKSQTTFTPGILLWKAHARFTMYLRNTWYALLPFSAKTIDSLVYVSNCMRARKNDADNWAAILLSFLNRSAELGIEISRSVSETVPSFTDVFAVAVKTNLKLVYLSLNRSYWSFNWSLTYRTFSRQSESTEDCVRLSLNTVPR